MESYNVDTDEVYNVPNSYKSKGLIITPEVSSYGTNSVSLPIYRGAIEQPVLNKKSRCPKGAVLGSIGTCCGMNCTRACAIPG